jgi:hypothetical protein
MTHNKEYSDEPTDVSIDRSCSLPEPPCMTTEAHAAASQHGIACCARSSMHSPTCKPAWHLSQPAAVLQLIYGGMCCL